MHGGWVLHGGLHLPDLAEAGAEVLSPPTSHFPPLALPGVVLSFYLSTRFVRFGLVARRTPVQLGGFPTIKSLRGRLVG